MTLTVLILVTNLAASSGDRPVLFARIAVGITPWLLPDRPPPRRLAAGLKVLVNGASRIWVTSTS